jgi:phosphatidylglycerol:prolipoprotein diacylglycerol transferase
MIVPVRQVLFEIPGLGLQIFGFGVMLFSALMVCMYLAQRDMVRQNANPQLIDSLVFWIVLPGIIGARLLYMVEYYTEFKNPFLQFFAIWQGGLVIYGSVPGALAGFLWFTYRRGIPRLWLLDLIAPTLAIGVGIGRLGCLLNGCCYGDYCTQPWGIQFPAGSGPYAKMVYSGWQSRLGFTTREDQPKVRFVEPGTPAANAGLAAGDEITAVNGEPVRTARDLHLALLTMGATGEKREKLIQYPESAAQFKLPFEITRLRDGASETLSLAPPRSLPLQPTQIYSAIDGLILFLFLSAYYPYRRRDGQVIALLAMCYSMTRFMIESLRFDEEPLFDGLTISQNISILIFTAGLLTWVLSSFSPRRYHPKPGDPAALGLADAAPRREAAAQQAGTPASLP